MDSPDSNPPSRSPEEAVLFNTDLLGIICNDLWTDGIQSLPGGPMLNPLVAMTMVCSSVSETALDRLWKDIHGFNPLLRVLNVETSGPNHSRGIWVSTIFGYIMCMYV